MVRYKDKIANQYILCEYVQDRFDILQKIAFDRASDCKCEIVSGTLFIYFPLDKKGEMLWFEMSAKHQGINSLETNETCIQYLYDRVYKLHKVYYVTKSKGAAESIKTQIVDMYKHFAGLVKLGKL